MKKSYPMGNEHVAEVNEQLLYNEAHEFAVAAEKIFKQNGWTYYFTDIPDVIDIETFAMQGVRAVLKNYPKKKHHEWTCGRVVVHRYKNEVRFSLSILPSLETQKKVEGWETETKAETWEMPGDFTIGKPADIDTLLNAADECVKAEEAERTLDGCPPDCVWCAYARKDAKEDGCTFEESVLQSIGKSSREVKFI